MDKKDTHDILYKIETINQKYEHFKLESKLGNKIVSLKELKEVDLDHIYSCGLYVMLNIMEHNQSYLAMYYHKTFNVDNLIFKDTSSVSYYFKVLKFIGTGYQKYIFNKEDLPETSQLVTYGSETYLKEWYCYYLTK